MNDTSQKSEHLVALARHKLSCLPTWARRLDVLKGLARLAEEQDMQQTDFVNYWVDGLVVPSGLNMYFPAKALTLLYQTLCKLSQRMWPGDGMQDTIGGDIGMLPDLSLSNHAMYAILGLDIRQQAASSRLKLWVQMDADHPQIDDLASAFPGRLWQACRPDIVGALVGYDFSPSLPARTELKKYIVLNKTEACCASAKEELRSMLGCRCKGLLKSSSFLILGVYRGDIQVHFRIRDFSSFYEALHDLSCESLPLADSPFFFECQARLVAIRRTALLNEKPIDCLTAYWMESADKGHPSF